MTIVSTKARHVMVDIESLGPAGSVVLSVAAVRFDDDGIGSTYFRAFDIWDQMMLGLNVDIETLAWWRQQNQMVRDTAQPQGRIPLDVGLTALNRFIDHGNRVWAKGPDYDIVSLYALYTKVNKKPSWRYHDVRDVRTIYALVGGGMEPTVGMEHSALDDAKAQALGVIAAAHKLGVRLDTDDYGK